MTGEGTDRDDSGLHLSAPTGHDQKGRDALEQAETRFRRSAAQLRSSSMPAQARRAEQFADRIRVDLDHPRAARLLRGPLHDPGALPSTAMLLDEVLEFGLELLHADRGNIQLADPATGVLRIAAQRGFGTEFLEYFAVVADVGSACGRAARQGAQVAIADVSTDPGYAPHRDIARASGYRAVQSTPLTDTSGRLVGMLSTLYPHPVMLPARELQIMTRFGALFGEWLSAPRIRSA